MFLGARLTAADSTGATVSVEQQFQEADVELAIEQYKKLRMAAFEFALKAQVETAQSDEQRVHLRNVQEKLEQRAEELRAAAIKTAAVALAKSR